MDGTIITTIRAWEQAHHKQLKSKTNLNDQECKKILQDHIGWEGASIYTISAFMKHKFNLQESVEEIIKETEHLACTAFKTEAQLINGFEKFHNQLTELNLKTAIATNASQNSLDKILKILPLRNFFAEHIYSIDIVNKIAKPKPDIYLYAAQKLNIEPQFCIAIEDSFHGIAAAKSAGMFCIGINTGKDRQALSQADHIIETYLELDITKLLK